MQAHRSTPRFALLIAPLLLVGTLTTALHVVSRTYARPAFQAPPPRPVPLPMAEAGVKPQVTPYAPDPNLDRTRALLLRKNWAALRRLNRTAQARPGDPEAFAAVQRALDGYNFLAAELTPQALSATGMPLRIADPLTAEVNRRVEANR